MAYYVGTQQFPSIYEASRFLAQNPQPGVTITSAPVAPAGMLTKPAPTTKQTTPVGTPSTPPKQMPGESGPFDPNAPVPTPAPAPQQTGPVGMPSSDPTKTQPGETGPFDPNAEPPAPAPAPEPEIELAPPKPLPDTKDVEPAPEPEGVTTFTFFRGDETGDANPAALYNRGDSTELTQAELQEYFSDEGSGMLREAFGTFNNYLAYMTEREQLIQSGDYDVGNWNEYSGSLTEDELMLLEGEDLTQYGDDAASDMPELEQRRLLEQSSAYDRWVNSEANQALLEKYGVGSTIYNQDGDKYEWNGSAYVKTVKVDDHAGVGDYVKAGILTAMNYFAGGALTDALVSTGMSATLASGTSAGILNAATQYAATGEVDFGDALDSAISAGLSTEIINQLTEAGVFDQLEESLNNLTQDTVQLADGTEIPYNGISVELADGSVVAIGDFLTQAAEAGNPVVAEITRSLPEFLDTIADAFETSGAAQGVVNILEGMTTETQPYPGSESPQVVVNIPSSGRDIFAGDAEQAEQVEETEEVPPEEDILADTTQEATGLEEGTITEDILGEYLEPIRADITASEERIISQTQEFLASALANLPPNISQEEVRVIVEEIVANAPQAETLSEEQVDSLVNSAVDAVRVDLETAETEREEIRVSQEAGFTQAEQDRQRLMEAIVEARGQTTELSQEMRDLLAQSNQTMQEMFEGTGVDIDELRSGQLSQEEATNALREYTESVREELLSGQEAIRSELSSDIQSLEDRLNSLPPEIREIVAEQLENLKVTENIDSVRQSVDALQEVVRNIQPGTTPEEVAEQVAEQIEQADLVTSKQLQVTAEGLFSAIQAMAEGQTVELTTAQSELLAEIAEGDAKVIERLSQYQGQLEDYLEERDITFDTVTGELSSDIERLQQQAGEFEEQVGERFDEATQQRLVLAQNLAAVDGRFEELSEADQRQYEELNLTINSLEEEFGVDFDRIEETQNILQEYAEEEFGLVREELRTGLETASEERIRIEQSTNDKLEQLREGIAVQFTDAEARRLEELTGLEYRLLQNSAANAEEFNALLAEQGIQFEEVTDVLRADIAASEQRTGERITGLEERMDANAIEQLAQLTGFRVEFLEGISNVEAAAIASSRGLSDQITEEITGIRGETAAQIEGMSERLTERIAEYETQTGEQLEMAEEERAVLGGQLGTLTSDVARVAEDVIRANGRIENMDAESRQRYDELGLSIDELSLRVGVNLEALQEGMLTQESAMRELIEETAQQTEERVGVQITGLGEQIAGLGEGVTGLGQALGVGLLGLAGAQPTAQEIAAAMPRQPVKFDPFLKGLSPFQPLTPLSLSPIQEKDATSELNKFIGRQTGMLV